MSKSVHTFGSYHVQLVQTDIKTNLSRFKNQIACKITRYKILRYHKIGIVIPPLHVPVVFNSIAGITGIPGGPVIGFHSGMVGN